MHSDGLTFVHRFVTGGPDQLPGFGVSVPRNSFGSSSLSPPPDPPTPRRTRTGSPSRITKMPVLAGNRSSCRENGNHFARMSIDTVAVEMCCTRFE